MQSRVLIVEDEVTARRAYGRILRAARFDLVGEAGDGREALRVAHATRPDAVLMDLWMARLNGWDATRLLFEEQPQVRILALSALDDSESVYRALVAGAAGFVSKYSPPAELVAGLRAVASGLQFFCSRTCSRPLERALAWQRDPGAAPKDLLTLPERQVLQLWAEDCSTADSAADLCRSVKTVESHRASIMRKLETRDVRELRRYAVERHLARPREGGRWERAGGRW
ncbi:MAG TPA: response regulator transcription factor [Polyangia bacterium]|jgi:DNA-binding NarL/FixJ family response regulator